MISESGWGRGEQKIGLVRAVFYKGGTEGLSHCFSYLSLSLSVIVRLYPNKLILCEIA